MSALRVPLATSRAVLIALYIVEIIRTLCPFKRILNGGVGGETQHWELNWPEIFKKFLLYFTSTSEL